MTTLKIGVKAPAFSLPASTADTISLADFKGKKLVLYFYPKDDTSGCTAQACAFEDNLKNFKKLGVQIVGISKDPIKSHIKFQKKYNSNFPLLSDEEGEVCAAYGVWVEKSMYGRKYMGIERSTFLIDEKGKIEKIWRKVSVTGHVDEVMAALKDPS